jgi:ribosomal protein L40E
MPQKYIHYFGNESSESLLEAYGIVTKDNISITSLNPKICNQCGESNTQDARFCSKCKTIMSFEGYQEVLEEQKKKEDKLAAMEDKFNTMQSQMETLVNILSSVKTQKGKQEIAMRLVEQGVYLPNHE